MLFMRNIQPYNKNDVEVALIAVLLKESVSQNGTQDYASVTFTDITQLTRSLILHSYSQQSSPHKEHICRPQTCEKGVKK